MSLQSCPPIPLQGEEVALADPGGEKVLQEHCDGFLPVEPLADQLCQLGWLPDLPALFIYLKSYEVSAITADIQEALACPIGVHRTACT